MPLLVILIAIVLFAYLLANLAFGLWMTYTFLIPVLLALLIYVLPATLLYYVAYRIWREFK